MPHLPRPAGRPRRSRRIRPPSSRARSSRGRRSNGPARFPPSRLLVSSHAAPVGHVHVHLDRQRRAPRRLTVTASPSTTPSDSARTAEIRARAGRGGRPASLRRPVLHAARVEQYVQVESAISPGARPEQRSTSGGAVPAGRYALSPGGGRHQAAGGFMGWASVASARSRGPGGEPRRPGAGPPRWCSSTPGATNAASACSWPTRAPSRLTTKSATSTAASAAAASGRSVCSTPPMTSAPSWPLAAASMMAAASRPGVVGKAGHCHSAATSMRAARSATGRPPGARWASGRRPPRLTGPTMTARRAPVASADSDAATRAPGTTPARCRPHQDDRALGAGARHGPRRRSRRAVGGGRAGGCCSTRPSSGTVASVPFSLVALVACEAISAKTAGAVLLGRLPQGKLDAALLLGFEVDRRAAGAFSRS